MSLRPGQVYWDAKRGYRVVVYSVRPEVVQVMLVTKHGRHHAARSLTWKHGVPKHYILLYDPPRRDDE